MQAECLICKQNVEIKRLRFGQFFECENCPNNLMTFTLIKTLTFKYQHQNELSMVEPSFNMWGTCFVVEYLSAHYLITARHNFRNRSQPYDIALNIAADFCIVPEKYAEYKDYFTNYQSDGEPTEDIVIFKLDIPTEEQKKYITERVVSKLSPEKLLQGNTLSEGDQLFVFGYSLEHENNAVLHEKKLITEQGCLIEGKYIKELTKNYFLLEQTSTHCDIENGFSGSPVFKKNGEEFELVGMMLMKKCFISISTLAPLFSEMQSNVTSGDSSIHVVYYVEYII